MIDKIIMEKRAFCHDEGSVGYDPCSKSPNSSQTSFIPRLHAVVRGNGALVEKPQ